MSPPLLIVLAGRPGTGKTTIGRLLAGRLQAAYLRTDVIVGPMLRAGLTEDEAGAARVGYDIACEVATENLHAGVPVVVDRCARYSRAASVVARCLGGNQSSLGSVGDDVAGWGRAPPQNRQPPGPGVGYLGPTWGQILEMKYDAWNEATDGPRLLVDTSDTDAALAASLAHVTRPNPA